MNILIRADSSIAMGTGHVMRCMALANQLTARGGRVDFLCSRLPGNIAGIVESNGFRVLWLEDGRPMDHYHWLIVDHYGLDERWEKTMRAKARHILVIDDLANRRHDCDVLLDQNMSRDLFTRYDSLVPPHTLKCLGPKYALLREEFAAARSGIKDRRHDTGHRRTNLFVSFGGTDPTNETVRVLKILKQLDKPFTANIVAGLQNAHLQEIRREVGAHEHLRLHVQPANMASLMLEADLAVCAGGTMTWERYCLALPGVIITTADNQIEIAREAQRQEIDRWAGHYSEVSDRGIMECIIQRISDKEQLQRSAEKAIRTVDGEGASRIANLLCQWVD